MGAYEEGWLRDKVKDQAAEIERLKLRTDTFERQYRQACADVAFAVNANKQLQASLALCERRLASSESLRTGLIETIHGRSSGIPCDRAGIVANRGIGLGWFNPQYRKSIVGTLRIALDMEVEAGGPYEVTRGKHANNEAASGAGRQANSEPGTLPDDERQGADSQPMEHDDRSGARKCTD